MKYFFTMILIATTWQLPLLAQSNSCPKELQTIESLDLDNYQGTWNQLAAIPSDFQKMCVANTTAEYTLLEGGTVKVVNSCDKANGERQVATGRARVNPKFNTSSKLQVTFFFKGTWIWKFAGDYWVTDITPDYETVLVGAPNFDYGWILSRKKSLTKSEYIEYEHTLRKQGYDTCKFMLSKTTEQELSQEISLCEFVK